MTDQATAPPIVDSVNKCRTHLDPFQKSYLPAECFRFDYYMQTYGLSKGDAKRIVQRNKIEQVFLNDTYQVNIKPCEDGQFTHVSIKRRDRQTIHDWRDLQAIKNMLIGPEIEAIELYPAESRLVDTANQYHLWAMRTDKRRFPVGFAERLVLDYDEEREDGSVQRPFPQLPPDIVTGQHIPDADASTTPPPESIPEEPDQ